MGELLQVFESLVCFEPSCGFGNTQSLTGGVLRRELNDQALRNVQALASEIA